MSCLIWWVCMMFSWSIKSGIFGYSKLSKPWKKAETVRSIKVMSPNWGVTQNFKKTHTFKVFFSATGGFEFYHIMGIQYTWHIYKMCAFLCIYIYVKIPTGEISPLKVQSNSPSSHNFRQFIDEKTIKIIQISKDFQRYISLEESSPLCLNDRKINWGVIHKSYIYIYHWGKRTCFNFEIIPTQFSTHSWKKIKSTCQSWRINFSVQKNGWTQNGGGLTQGRKNGSHKTLKIFTPQLNEQFHPLVNWATKNKKNSFHYSYWVVNRDPLIYNGLL